MTLQTGTKLGSYEILSPLGAGGMGEVYLANSSKLDRKMTAVVIALYSYMALRYIVIYHNVTGDIVTLADTLTKLGLREDSSLGWLEIGAGISTMHIAQSVAMFLSFVASLIFFFHTKQRSNE